MTVDEFLARAGRLVGPGQGAMRRTARLLGVREGTIYAAKQGKRRLPPAYEERLREAEQAIRVSGSALAFIAPRLMGVCAEAEAAGISREQALAAVAGWAARELGAGRE